MIKKVLGTITITILILITGMFFMSKPSLAYGTWNKDASMPQRGQYSPVGGLLPQIYENKEITGEPDTEFPYTSWEKEVSAGTVYCADSGKALRFGKFDDKMHYADEALGAIPLVTYQNYEYFKFKMCSVLNDIGKEIVEKKKSNLFQRNFEYIATTPLKIGYKQIQGPTEYDNELYKIEEDKPMIVTQTEAEYGDGETTYNYSKVEAIARMISLGILKNLDNWDRQLWTEDKSTNPILPAPWLYDAIDGPEVVVMETDDRKGDGYGNIEALETKTANNYTGSIRGNANIAYILTAMENAYEGVTGTINSKYNLADIQTAYWEAVDIDGIAETHETNNGLELYKKAQNYQKFVNEYLIGIDHYKATMDLSQAQVITNRATKQYIIGPITTTYPYYEDISYMKAIYLVTEGGQFGRKTLVYDENTDDFSIEFVGGGSSGTEAYVSGSNGLKKKYPASGSKFYIKFSAQDTGYPTSVSVYADYEYLQKAEIQYKKLETKANVYRYIGYVASSRDYDENHRNKRLRLAYGTAEGLYTYRFEQLVVSIDPPSIQWIQSVWGGNITIDGNHYRDRTYIIAQPFVLMTREPVREITSQKLTLALDGERKYAVYHLEAHKDNIIPPDNSPSTPPDTPPITPPVNPPSTPPGNPPSIDLTLDIGGKVWVDGDVGKEDTYDGKYGDEDTPMSNVKVSLYEIPISGTLPSNKPKPDLPDETTDPEEPEKPGISSSIYLIYNRNTGESLYEKDQDKQASIASIAKIVTALIVSEQASLDDVVTVGPNAVGTTLRQATWSPKLQIVGLQEGDKVTVRDLLRATLVYSGCDAAVALAEHIAGSQGAFVNMMNEKVSALGLNNTHFATAYGINANDKSSAKDLAKFLDVAMENNTFSEIFKEGSQGAIEVTIQRNGAEIKKSLYSTNPMQDTAGIEGTKTGMIGAAGYCVLASFKMESEEYAIVVLGAKSKEQRNEDARKLAQYLLEKITYEKKKAGQTDSTGGTGSGISGGILDQGYSETGRFVAATTTDENGDYKFENLNSMYNYYVKFTYNGQYYEPTIYNANREDENWNVNSKGLDIANERDLFNAKFRDIGSAPENLLKPAAEMHTRQELEDEGLIDKFGNIVGSVSEDGKRESSDTYVNESMMDSYTCNGTSKRDLYPNIDVFVNDETKNNLIDTEQILNLIESNDVKTIYANPDIMRHVNQGYVQRETVDLAIKKDVYKATIEINDNVEEYIYNKRDGLITGINGNAYWEIEQRQDGYYNQAYTREIYREDYAYKVEDYSNIDAVRDILGISQDSELKVFVTYKFTIRNSSYGIATAVTEVVDYYDKDFTPVPERSYLGDKDGNSIGSIVLSEESRYSNATQKNMDGYNRIYVTGSKIYSGVANDIESYGCLPLSDPNTNKDIYFYLTFEVKKDENRNILLDSDSGKENVAEINGYKSYYTDKAVAPNKFNTQTQAEFKTGDIAGIPDKDSTPGNLREIDTSKFEDDTDKAPNIKITLTPETSTRTITGTVWEDKRTEEVENAMVGNGEKDDGETGVNGVRVQLVEIKEGFDGIKYEYIWKEVTTGSNTPTSAVIPSTMIFPYSMGENGEYVFKGLIPGEYIVRYIYGSTEDTVLGEKSINYNTGEEQQNPVTQALGRTATNEKSYNGHDYKSTLYQINTNNGTSAYKDSTSGSYTYNFEEADGKNQSDAKDIMEDVNYDSILSILESISNWRVRIAKDPLNLINSFNTREEVENYSNGDVLNELAEKLASFESLPTDRDKIEEYLKELMNNTYMTAETGIILMKGEYNREQSETSLTGSINTGTSNYDKSGHYILEGLDFGIVERPKAQLKVTKQITNVKVALANNSILFDASDRATNVLWLSHKAHGQDTNNTYSESDNYSGNMMKNPEVRQSSTNKGKVQLTMDEELMHGSTIQITYAITVANVGEVDYKENKFYYTGTVEDTNNIVKTYPRMLVDYVGTQVHDYTASDDKTATRNNLQFNQQQNPDWSVISSTDLLNRGLLNNKLQANVEKYTDGHIVITDKASKGLIPIIADQDNVKDKIKEAFKNDPLHAVDIANTTQSISGVQLILTQMITADNDLDDMIYNNLTELVTTKNDVGRRMAYSIVGNQDPTVEPREIDADDSEEVVILPPFGQQYIYYVLGIAVATILIAGIIITIVVLKKKK